MGLSFLFNRYQPNELFFEKATLSLKPTFELNPISWTQLMGYFYALRPRL